MAMEIIQEFAENQSYLHALTTLKFQPIVVQIEEQPADSEDGDLESEEAIMSHPLARLCFRYHLSQRGAFHLLLFLDMVREYRETALSQFKLRLAKKILSKFLSKKARMHVPVTAETADATVLEVEQLEEVVKTLHQRHRSSFVTLNPAEIDAAMSIVCGDEDAKEVQEKESSHEPEEAEDAHTPEDVKEQELIESTECTEPAEPIEPTEPIEETTEPIEAPTEPIEAPTKPIEAPTEPIEETTEIEQANHIDDEEEDEKHNDEADEDEVKEDFESDAGERTEFRHIICQPRNSEPLLRPFDKIFEAAQSQVEKHLMEEHFVPFLHSPLHTRLQALRRKQTMFVGREDFDFIRVLGKGGFGKVYGVSKRDTKAVYACKVMDKQLVLEKKREALILNERRILAMCKHPYVVGLKFAFQDERKLYFVMDILTGGDLQFQLQRFRRFSLSMVRFYAAGIFLAVEYLHSKRIVYRDLKPENVLLDADGFVRLVDLGLCAELPEDGKLTQHCGTRAYMAPEQMVGKHYGREVDLWAFGVTLLRMLSTSNPFRQRRRQQERERERRAKERKAAKDPRPSRRSKNEEDAHKDEDKTDKTDKTDRTDKITSNKDETSGLASPDKIDVKKEESEEAMTTKEREREERRKRVFNWFEDVVDSLEFSERVPEEARDLVRKLLRMNPQERLGARNMNEIRQHPFFASVDWDRMLKRHVVPPFRPSSRSVNAEYVEAAYGNDGKRSPNSTKHFEDFEYVDPDVFEEEVMSAIHSKTQILGIEDSKPQKRRFWHFFRRKKK